MTVIMLILSIVYPVIVFVFLYFLKTPVRVLSLFIIIVAAGVFLSVTSRKKDGDKKSIDIKQVITSVLLLTAGLLCLVTNKIFFLKLYSVSISAIFLILFGSTLFFEPTMIFRFATLADKSIIGSSCENQVRKYCRTVTIVWCCFFILNGTISTVTAFSQNIFHITEEQADKVWTIYNGAVSYVLMGLLFAIEFCIRKIYDSHLIKAVPVSKMTIYSRKESHVLCVGCNGRDKKTWGDFLSETEFYRNRMNEKPDEKIVLSAENEWNLLTTLCAAIQCKKRPVIDFENTNALPSHVQADSDTVKITKHSQPIPEIDREKSIIEVPHNGSLSEISLSSIEDKIDSVIQAEGKKLILQKQPSSVEKNDPEQYIVDLLLLFTLGKKFYSKLNCDSQNVSTEN